MRTGVLSALSHPLDILRFIRTHRGLEHRVAAIFILATDGGNIRAPGLRMAVASDGDRIGYVSNGCVERDIVEHALQAIQSGEQRRLAYGSEDHAIDIRLSCGGRIEVLVQPQSDAISVDSAIRALEGRTSCTISVARPGASGHGDDGPRFTLIPKVRLRIVGSGVEAISLAKIATCADFDCHVVSPDCETVEAARKAGLAADLLRGFSQDWAQQEDRWTAHVFMLHDLEWEEHILPHVVAGPSFYIGALGSKVAHSSRVDRMRRLGVEPRAIDRIRAPVGIVPKLRDANLLAVSILGEVTQAFRDAYEAF